MSVDISPEAVTEALQDLRAHEWTSTADMLEALAARVVELGALVNPVNMEPATIAERDMWRDKAQAVLARVAELEAELASAERQDFFDLQGKIAAALAREAKLREALESTLNACRHFYYGTAFEKEFEDELAALQETKP